MWSPGFVSQVGLKVLMGFSVWNFSVTARSFEVGGVTLSLAAVPEICQEDYITSRAGWLVYFVLFRVTYLKKKVFHRNFKIITENSTLTVSEISIMQLNNQTELATNNCDENFEIKCFIIILQHIHSIFLRIIYLETVRNVHNRPQSTICVTLATSHVFFSTALIFNRAELCKSIDCDYCWFYIY